MVYCVYLLYKVGNHISTEVYSYYKIPIDQLATVVTYIIPIIPNNPQKIRHKHKIILVDIRGNFEKFEKLNKYNNITQNLYHPSLQLPSIKESILNNKTKRLIKFLLLSDHDTNKIHEYSSLSDDDDHNSKPARELCKLLYDPKNKLFTELQKGKFGNDIPDIRDNENPVNISNNNNEIKITDSTNTINDANTTNKDKKQSGRDSTKECEAQCNTDNEYEISSSEGDKTTSIEKVIYGFNNLQKQIDDRIWINETYPEKYNIQEIETILKLLSINFISRDDVYLPGFILLKKPIGNAYGDDLSNFSSRINFNEFVSKYKKFQSDS
jgi:hypothetical protein